MEELTASRDDAMAPMEELPAPTEGEASGVAEGDADACPKEDDACSMKELADSKRLDSPINTLEERRTPAEEKVGLAVGVCVKKFEEAASEGENDDADGLVKELTSLM
jgi:hypothetical protein